MDHVYSLSEAIKLNTSTPKAKVFVCFVDLRRAFDEVDRNLILLRLTELGIKGWMYDAFDAIYRQPECTVRLGLNGEKTDWITSNYRTLQGDVISPQIFSCQINTLIEKLNNSSNGIYYGSGHDDRFSCLAFADDLALVAPTTEKLQSPVNILQEHCYKHRMTVNVDKTKCMVFRKNHQTKCDTLEIKYGNRTVEQVKSYKYLGVYFDECLKFGLAAEDLAGSASRAFGSVMHKTRHHKDLGLKTYTRIINSCVT